MKKDGTLQVMDMKPGDVFLNKNLKMKFRKVEVTSYTTQGPKFPLNVEYLEGVHTGKRAFMCDDSEVEKLN